MPYFDWKLCELLDDRGMLLSSLRVRPNDDRLELGMSLCLQPVTTSAFSQSIDRIEGVQSEAKSDKSNFTAPKAPCFAQECGIGE